MGASNDKEPPRGPQEASLDQPSRPTALATKCGERRFFLPLAQVLPVRPVDRPCQHEGCRAWARKGSTLCASHQRQQQRASAQNDNAANQRLLLEFFRDIFSPEEYEAVNRQVTLGQPMEVEMAIIRVLLYRVMKSIGTTDPKQALPLVRQAVDALCRTLRTQRVISGQAGETFSQTLAALIEQWTELSAPAEGGEHP